jgi:hypothetical protein
MKRLLILALVLLLAVGQVGATRATFQDFSIPSGITYSPDVALAVNPTTGQIVLDEPAVTSNIYVNPGSAFSYVGVDTISVTGSDIPACIFLLLDSSYAEISRVSWIAHSGDRAELKIIGGTPTLFVNGINIGAGRAVSVNPSYLRIVLGNSNPYGYTNIQFDNILVGETDHRIIGPIPINWTIIRDMINPSATGVYGWNPQTKAWVLINSYTMVCDADTDSTDATYTENLQITNVQYGAVVNSSPIDSTVPRHQVSYNVSSLINTPTALGTAIPDGEYSVCFEGSTVCQNFWIISNGASVSLDKSSYVTGESAIVTSTMLPAYFDVVTYSYALVTKDVYGTTLNSQAINTATQTSTVTFDTAGVRYIEVVATKRSDSTTYIMGYASVTVYDYLQFSGIVYDGGTGAALSGAAYNFTSSSGITHAGVSGFDGNFTVTGFGSGGTLWYNFTKSGYVAYNYSFSPLSTGPKPLTITLKPISPTGTGAMLQGVVHDSVYGSMIPSVTSVTATNGSESHMITPDAVTSYYLFDDTRGGPLTAGKCYTLNAVKAGYLFVAPANPQCVVAA